MKKHGTVRTEIEYLVQSRDPTVKGDEEIMEN